MFMRERRFAHAGPGGQDYKLGIVQAAGEVVEIDEAGFDAAVRMLMLHAGIDAGERLVEHFADRRTCVSPFVSRMRNTRSSARLSISRASTVGSYAS